jgi:hypothetical protein
MRRVIVMLLVAAFVVSLWPAAVAAGGPAGASPAGGRAGAAGQPAAAPELWAVEAQLRGGPATRWPLLHGALAAQGSGAVAVRGNVEVRLASGRRATVLVHGASYLESSGWGDERELRGGWTLYTDWQGEIIARGEQVTLCAFGSGLTLNAAGSGTAIVKGRGTYSVGAVAGSWQRRGTTLRFQP